MQKLDNNTVILNGGRITTDRNGVSTFDNRSIYSQVTSKMITNTDVETSFFNDTSCIGSRTIPANTLSVGDIIRVNTRADFTSIGNPTNIIKIKADSVTLVSHTATLGAGHTNDYAEIQCDIMITAIGDSGSAVCMGRTYLVGGTARNLIASTPITIDTTAPLVIDVTYTWGTASDSNILINVTGTIQLIN